MDKTIRNAKVPPANKKILLDPRHLCDQQVKEIQKKLADEIGKDCVIIAPRNKFRPIKVVRFKEVLDMNIEKLKKLAEQHALWKKWRVSGQIVEQQGIQLIVTNDSIIGANLSKQELAGAEFDESPMQKVVLRNANLQYAEFSNLVLEDVDFSGADCQHLFLFSSRLVRCIGKSLKNSNSIIWENCQCRVNHHQISLSEFGKISANFSARSMSSTRE